MIGRREVKKGGFFGFFRRREIEITVTPEKPVEPTKPESSRVKSEKEKPVIVCQAPPDLENIKKILKLVDKGRKNSEPKPEIKEKPDALLKEPHSKSEALEGIGDQVSSIKKKLDDLQNSVLAPENPESRFGLDTLPLEVRQLGEKLTLHRVKPEKVQKICANIAETLKKRGNSFSWSLSELFKEELQNLVSIKNFELYQGQCQVISLIGPTGTGKTSTIAKMAAKWKLSHENLKIVFITLDTYRIGATEQLLKHGEILGIPVEVIDCDLPEREKMTKEKVRKYCQDGYNLIFIDTPGRSPNDPHEITSMCEELAIPELSNFLVLTAGSKEADQENILKKFSRANPKGCIITKLDETKKFGFLINLSEAFRTIPIYCLTNGQEIHKDLVFPSHNNLTGLFLSEKDDE